MSRNETHEEAEARYASWADAAERGELHPTGEFWINPDHPDCRPGRPKSGERRPSSMVSVRLNEADEERLDQFLAKTGQARSDVLRTALDEYLTRHRA